MKCKRLYVLIALNVFCFCVFAQKSHLTRKLNEMTKLGLSPLKAISQYQCDIWQKDKGLPQNTVFSIIQTSDGFLWIATYEGLARFDGVEFANFNTTNVEELITSGIWEIFEDSQKNIWIGTNNGGLSRLSKGKFKTFTTNEGLPSNNITDVQETQDKTIWIATKQGLVAYRNNTFKTYTNADGLSSRDISCLYVGKDNALWIGTNRGISVLKDGKFEDLSRSKILMISKNVTSITEDDQGFLWIGTHSGLVRWDERTGKSKTFRIQDGLTDEYISKLFFDNRGTLWIGTQSGGLHRIIHSQLASNAPVIHTFSVKEGLSSNSITELYEDYEGSLWIGTNRGGLNRLRDGKFTNYTMKEGLTDNVTNCVLKDRNGGLWIGTVSGGLSYFKEGKFRNFTTENGLSNNYIRSIMEDTKGDIWVATYGGGINKILWSQNKINPQIISLTSREGLANNITRAIIQAQNGAIWIATKNGLSKWEKGRFTNYTKQDGLSDNSIMGILEDSKQNIWVGTDGYGLNCILPNNQIIQYNTRKGLANNLVFCIYEDKKGKIWVGTKGGLSCIVNQKAVSIYAKDGLVSDAIHSIVEDDMGNLWMSSNSGIFQVEKVLLDKFVETQLNSSKESKKLLKCTHYSEEDGMKSSDCAASAQPTVIKDEKGYLWYPTTEGITMIDPSNIKINYKKPPVVIKTFLADNEEYPLFENKLFFKAGISKFEIDYAALSFLAPNKIHYRYKLVGDGFQEDWIDAKNKRDTYYTNLPPGNYTFTVQAMNHDGIWNQEGATVQFYLEPLFYQTRWFYGFMILGILSIGFGLYYWRVNNLEKSKKILQKKLEENAGQIRAQFKEITLQAEELQTINQIVKIINQEVHFENVLKALLEQGLLLFPQSNKGIFLLYKPEESIFELVSLHGYELDEFTKREFTLLEVMTYCETGINLGEEIYILQPAINLKKLAPNYRPKSSVAMMIRTNQDELQGVIFFDNTSGFQDVQPTDIQKLIRFKEHAVSAFLKARILREIAIKNEEVETSYRKMSDSIRYARRIQAAILNKEEEIAAHFEEIFILYRPKDIVSGDFYWFMETIPEPIYANELTIEGRTSVFKGFEDTKKIIAAVDCTGHGVPGAFMTVIGNDLLNSIVMEEKVTKAAKILERLDKNVRKYLKQEEGSQSRDGMDMALLVIDDVHQKIEFAAAKSTAYFIRDGQLTELKGSKFPIGGAQIQNKIFESQEISYQKEDIFYLLSDGFQDQFGGGVKNGHERKYSSRRLKEFLLMIHRLPLVKQKEALEQELELWMGNTKQIDDILLIGLKL